MSKVNKGKAATVVPTKKETIKENIKQSIKEIKRDFTAFLKFAFFIKDAGVVHVRDKIVKGAAPVKRTVFTIIGVAADGKTMVATAWDEHAEQFKTYFEVQLKNSPEGLLFLFPQPDDWDGTDLIFRPVPLKEYNVRNGQEYVFSLATSPPFQKTKTCVQESMPVPMEWIDDGFELDGVTLKHPSHWDECVTDEDADSDGYHTPAAFDEVVVARSFDEGSPKKKRKLSE
jgi:hypothetical protein